MRLSRAIWSGVLVGLIVGVGCKHRVEYNTEVPLVEEFREPPHEARFDNPPEQGLARPKAKKEFKAGLESMPGSPGAGGTMGSAGFGAPRR